MLLRIALWTSRLLLAGIFIYAGYTKLGSPLQFASAIEQYQLVPTAATLWIVNVLPWAEIVLGVFLLVGWRLGFFAAVSVALLALFVGAMAVTYARGIEADCGCFGVGEKISPYTLTRDALLMVPGIFLSAMAWSDSRKRVESP